MQGVQHIFNLERVTHECSNTFSRAIQNAEMITFLKGK